MATKMTMFFNQANAGFSETWYNAAVNPKALYDSLAKTFYDKSIAFRDYLTTLKAVRFSNTQLPRQSYLFIPQVAVQGKRGSAFSQKNADVISTTAVYSITSANLKLRRVWFRGLNDEDVLRDSTGTDFLTPQVSKLVDSWMNALKNEGFAIRYTVLPPDALLTWRKLQIVNHVAGQSADRANLIPAVADPPLTVGGIYSVGGIPSSLPRFPRKVEILSLTTIAGLPHYEIAYQLPGGVGVAPKNLRVTLHVPATVPLDIWQFERFSEHKTGRPFGSLRGRARAVAVLR